MTGSALARDLAIGATAGYVGSRVMDRATTVFYDRMSPQDKHLERQTNPDGTGLTVGRALGRALGKDGDEAAGMLAMRMHRGLGMTYGVTAAALAARGMPPLQAGVVTGAAAFVLVDEAALSAVLPPPTAYPLASHLRGVVGHLTLGASVGLLLTAARQVTR